MKVVYKYHLASDTVRLPVGAEILHIGVQNDMLFAWALHETEGGGPPTEKVDTFRVAGTGHPIQNEHVTGKFWGTHILVNGTLVFHVWQLTK